MFMPVQTARRIVKALALVIDCLMVYEWIHLLETKHTLRFWNRVSR
jgi:predicted metal-dependent hydrolase